MKKIVLSTLMVFALSASMGVMAQEAKTCDKAKTECTKKGDKKAGCTKDQAKKECCSKDKGAKKK